jgi:hypothetical protein
VYQNVKNQGPYDYLVIDWRFNSLPGFDQDAGGGNTPDSFSEAIPYIPKGSIVVDVHTVITQAFAGGTSYVMGTYQKNGTVIDADGFYNATELALANMDAVGDYLRPNGVDVLRSTGTFDDFAVSATQDAYVLVTATGTFTAGRARTVVQYMPPGPGL